MSFKSKLLLGGAMAFGTVGVMGLGVASAASDSGGENNLVDKIATKFNLNKGEVQMVFDEDIAVHKAVMEGRFEEQLDKAVADGELTADQKDKILAKHAEIAEQRRADREALKGKTQEEMHALFQSRHEALKQWAAASGIPMEYLAGPGMAIGVHGMSVGDAARPPDVAPRSAR